MVLPITSKVNPKGHLEIGGCDSVELAAKYGTPLFVYDADTIERQCRAYMDAFKDEVPQYEVIYAAKAFICLAMCQLIQKEGLALDVSSGGELYTALKAGFPAEKLYMHGNNKTVEELELAIGNNVGTIVADSFIELERIDDIAGKLGKTAKVMLRLTPGVHAYTHKYIQTGQEDSKFGFGLQDGIAQEAVKKALSSKNIDFSGYHAHIGSQIFATESFAKAIEVIIAFTTKMKDETGFIPRELNLGGGLGIKYKANDEPSTIKDYAKVITTNIKEQVESAGLPLPKLLVEPGRSIVGNSAVTLYSVGTIKKIPKIRTYVSVEGGMSDNLRPMLYQAKYEALLANKAGDKLVDTVTISGKHCESSDVLVEEAKLPEVEVGDIVCTPATGAYGYSMANNYNRQPRPAVIMVKNGKSQVIIERESYKDLLKLDREL